MGCNIALVLGGLILFSAFGNNLKNLYMINLGLIMIVGALAYKSAARRKLGELTDSKLRKAFEIGGIISIGLLVILQNNLLSLIVDDPISNLIAPIWALSAYLIVFLKNQFNRVLT
jgi:hypothetical protein